MRFEILNERKSSTVASRARKATGLFSRARGLMFTSSLPRGEALIIDPCSSIHMFGMRYPLDVLYVSKDHEVMRVQEGIKPWRVGPLRTRGAHYVIELPVGTIADSMTTVGDRLAISAIQSDSSSR